MKNCLNPSCAKPIADNELYCSDLCMIEHQTSETPTSSEGSNYSFVEVQAQKLQVEPGDTIIFTIKQSEITDALSGSLNRLGDNLRKIFKDNQVIVLGVEPDGDVKISVVKQPTLPVAEPVNLGYCNNCDCGKKEAAEQAKEEKS